MEPVDAALQELLRNDTERSTLALSTVQKIVNNILSHQDEPKYRRLRAENKAIKEKVLDVVGGGALLQALGFTAQGDELVLPMESSPVKLLQVRREPRLKPVVPDPWVEWTEASRTRDELEQAGCSPMRSWLQPRVTEAAATSVLRERRPRPDTACALPPAVRSHALRSTLHSRS